MYNLYLILKTLQHDVLLVRQFHLVSPTLVPSGTEGTGVYRVNLK
jgi:hypothetical protein